jgi:hypothetical protein
VPRLWTPPLRELTPQTSYGYDAVDFVTTVLGEQLDPWQEWLLIHAGELLPDGRPRFRYVLAIIARQQGKTFLLTCLTLYWLFVERWPMVLSTSTNRETAKESWRAACQIAQSNEYLSPEVSGVRHANGEESLSTVDGCRYKIAASNRRGGRGLSVDRLIIDELREHHSFEAWSAATHAMSARPYGQAFAISNQGDEASIVLDSLRQAALAEVDPRAGLFEWSAPPNSDPTDLAVLAQSNPSLGYGRVDADALVGAAMRAKAAGGAELAAFRTEVLCEKVTLLDPAVDPDRWTACGTDSPVDLAGHRRQVALCVDVALDGSHATLAAAALVDDQVHVEIVRAWDGYGCTKQLREELPAEVARIKPRALGWFPSGPAAAVAADLADRGHRGWPPRRVDVAEIRGDATAVCMGLVELVVAEQLRHPRDEMLDQHVGAASKLWRGDAWTFQRRGVSAIDGLYAIAGAVHLARTLPPAPPPPSVAWSAT